MLVWDKVGVNEKNSTLAVMAGIAGACFYGLAANYSKKYMVGIKPLALATGSLIGAALFLLPLAVYTWPETTPSSNSWFGVVVLAVFCTSLAYIIYFRLLENVGPANATAVTFLIPLFGLLWGAVYLDEIVTVEMIAGCAVILLGTGLTTGFIRFKRRPGSMTET